MEKVKRYITKENIIIAIILLVSVCLSSLFIFNSKIYKGVDTEYHLSRIEGIVNSWRANNFLAYIHLDDTGYGYAMGFFYSNLFMILPCLLYMAGVNIFTAYKIFIFICGIFTGLSMYICVKKITKSKYGATIAMVLYTTCSYRIITMVAKAFIGEVLSFIFIPIIILGLYKIIFEDEKKWWIFTIGFVGILNSNLVMTEIMMVISIVILLCNCKKFIKEKNRIISLIKASVLALLVSAIFWLPMLEQLGNSTFKMKSSMEIYRPERWLIECKNLFWGSVQCTNNLAAAYGLGIIFIIIMPFRLKIKEQNNVTKLCDILILSGLILLVLMTNLFPWNKFKIGGVIQFPSRFEVCISAFFSIVCGIICSYIAKNKMKKMLLISIIIWQSVSCVIVLGSSIQAIDRFFIINNKEIYVDDDFKYNICDGVYLPEDGDYSKAQMSSENEIETNNKQLEYRYNKENLIVEIEFENKNLEKTYVEIPMYYYYGYVAESLNDGSNYEIEKGQYGKIRIYLGEKEQDTIKVYYKTTTIQKISIIITVITLISLIIYMILKSREDTRKAE